MTPKDIDSIVNTEDCDQTAPCCFLTRFVRNLRFVWFQYIYSFTLQKKRKKGSQEEAGEGDGPNLMQDHEELEGDNTPGVSPRDETTEGNVVENDVGHEKVRLRFLNTRVHTDLEKSLNLTLVLEN